MADQYKKWQPKLKCKQALDPTLDDVKRICCSMRRRAKDEPVRDSTLTSHSTSRISSCPIKTYFFVAHDSVQSSITLTRTHNAHTCTCVIGFRNSVSATEFGSWQESVIAFLLVTLVCIYRLMLTLHMHIRCCSTTTVSGCLDPHRTASCGYSTERTLNIFRCPCTTSRCDDPHECALILILRCVELITRRLHRLHWQKNASPLLCLSTFWLRCSRLPVASRFCDVT